MSVLDENIVDFASIDKNKKLVLTISDHLEWDDENWHLIILQNKINFYLMAIEDSDLFEKYPYPKDGKIIIEIRAKYHPNNDGIKFLNMVKNTIETAGYEFSFEVAENKK